SPRPPCICNTPSGPSCLAMTPWGPVSSVSRCGGCFPTPKPVNTGSRRVTDTRGYAARGLASAAVTPWRTTRPVYGRTRMARCRKALGLALPLPWVYRCYGSVPDGTGHPVHPNTLPAQDLLPVVPVYRLFLKLGRKKEKRTEKKGGGDDRYSG